MDGRQAQPSGRMATAVGTLARRGFSDAGRAVQLVAELAAAHPGCTDAVVDATAGADDPDQALSVLARLQREHPDRVGPVLADLDWLGRLTAVCGASQALGQHVATRPDALGVLRHRCGRDGADAIQARLLAAVGQPGADDAAAAGDRLRLANRDELVRIAAWDLTSPDPVAVVADVAAELADLADAVLTAALVVARAHVPDARDVPLAVVGLGKCGAQELNYASDVDVLYVARSGASPAELAAAQALAAELSRVCSAHTAAGSIWPLDGALRPEGNAGPLVRTLDAMAAYYQRWAKPWEFQAMLKARPIAGDLELGAQFCDLVDPMVWQVGGGEGFVAAARAMRQRVVSLIPAAQRDTEIKLGDGGLRDVEFPVQILQLVHGRGDARLRARGTLAGLHALVEHGYVGRADGERLEAAYRFERCLEHRAQLWTLRRTHLLPHDPAGLRRVARSLREPTGDALWARWRTTSAQVRQLQQQVFYSPLLEAVSRIPSADLALSSQAADERLRGLGFADPPSALRHIAALTQGVSRSVEIQRHLMPAMLGWLAEGPNPDAGLLAFRQVSESMGATAWYLRALRDQGATAERLARLLASSRYAVDLLRRDPPSVHLLTDDALLAPRPRADMHEAMAQAAARHEDAADAVGAVRALRRRELFRIAAGDVLGVLDVDAVGRGLSDLVGATLDACLGVAAAHGDGVPPLGLVAMGRWGGAELGFASDADAMVVVPDGTDERGLAAAVQAVALVRRLLAAPGPEPALPVDLDLRPEGRDGAVARTVTSYADYYARWSATWESQALLRAAYGAGDPAPVNDLLDRVAGLRWPEDGLDDEQVMAIRKLKLRMQRERARDRAHNLKLGPGGLSDVEWTVQLLQLKHAAQVPDLRTTRTLDALAAATQAGLIAPADADALRQAWTLASRLRNATMLVRGRASDTLPGDARETAQVAMLLGYGPGEASALQADWDRAARLALRVVDHVFWGA